MFVDTVDNRPALIMLFTEAVAQRGSVKKIFLEITQNSQENTCSRVSFLIRPWPATLFKKRLWHRCFPVNFAKFLRAAFLKENLRWLLLYSTLWRRKSLQGILDSYLGWVIFYSKDSIENILFCKISHMFYWNRRVKYSKVLKINEN